MAVHRETDHRCQPRVAPKTPYEEFRRPMHLTTHVQKQNVVNGNSDLKKQFWGTVTHETLAVWQRTSIKQTIITSIIST